MKPRNEYTKEFKLYVVSTAIEQGYGYNCGDKSLWKQRTNAASKRTSGTG